MTSLFWENNPLLLERIGYGAFVEIPKSGDGGIDGIMNEDELELAKIYIQAKRYSENNTREKEIRNFIRTISGDIYKEYLLQHRNSMKMQGSKQYKHSIVWY